VWPVSLATILAHWLGCLGMDASIRATTASSHGMGGAGMVCPRDQSMAGITRSAISSSVPAC
jgi:hypothetical protein